MEPQQTPLPSRAANRATQREREAHQLIARDSVLQLHRGRVLHIAHLTQRGKEDVGSRSVGGVKGTNGRYLRRVTRLSRLATPCILTRLLKTLKIRVVLRAQVRAF